MEVKVILNEDIPRYLNLFNQNIAQLNNLITDKIFLENINEAIESMKKGKTVGSVLIEMK